MAWLPMTITFSQAQIDEALPRVKEGLQQYLWLQSRVAGLSDFYQDAEFRRRYNHFYRVRRGEGWQRTFYGLMARAKGEHLRFQEILDKLRRATNRYEASFASKLVATLDPSKPVIDAVVLKNLGLRLPAYASPNRAAGICVVYSKLISLFSAFLNSEKGEYLAGEFRRVYPSANVTDVKMLDLVLWKTRG